jgi:hypothetical protein
MATCIRHGSAGRGDFDFFFFCNSTALGEQSGAAGFRGRLRRRLGRAGPPAWTRPTPAPPPNPPPSPCPVPTVSHGD